MKKTLLIVLLCVVSIATFSQIKMRSVEELINKEDPGWFFVKEWIDSAKNKVEILEVDSIKAEKSLYEIQVTTRSPMGSIVYMTGGIVIDNGWIRILGAGGSEIKRSLPDWNMGKSINEYGQPAPFLLIADDAVGGFFMLNGGQFGNDIGKVYYFSPDNLEYEALDLTYTEFLLFCFNYDLNEFYEGLRWKGWEKDIENLNGDEVFNFYPYLWTKEGSNIEKTSKKVIPIEEQFQLNLSLRNQLGY